MTLTLYTARQNEGKTLGLVVETFKDWLRGRTIYTNIPLNFPHILINKDFLIDIVQKGINISDATFLLDEVWLWIDSRLRDRIMSYFYLQSSKDNLNINMSAQTERQVDVRLRENLHKWGYCSRYLAYKGKLIRLPKDFFEVRILPKELQPLLFIKVELFTPIVSVRRNIGFDDFQLSKTRFIHAQDFFKLYDTKSKVKIKVK